MSDIEKDNIIDEKVDSAVSPLNGGDNEGDFDEKKDDVEVNEKGSVFVVEKGTVVVDDEISVADDEKGSVLAENSVAAGSLEIKKKANKRENAGKAKQKKKNANSMADEVKKVEEKLKMREMVRLTVLSVEVSNLPSVHRFTKNLPWLQGAYGNSYSWVADYTESGTGDKASWGDLKWGFNIERNIADRSDFVLTVCSQKLIIGRYVLNREEFVNIPDTRSGFFEVKGSILNGAGLAGSIKLVFQKGVADRPTGPPKKVDSPSLAPKLVRSTSLSSIENASRNSPIKNSPPSNLNESSAVDDPSVIKFVFVKVVSIAVIEMKAVHLLESNSPAITAECGKWVGVSDVVRGAGSAVRWSSLNWKFSVKNEEHISANVASNSKLIGNVSVSMAEIVEAELKPNGMREVVKHINNGKEITGKIKFNFVVKIPMPDDMHFTRSTASIANNGMDNGEYAEEKGGEYQLSNRTKSLDSNDSNRHTMVNDREEVHSLAQRSTTIPSNVTLSAERLKIKAPFVIRVSDLTVLDSVPVHLLTKNSLSVNVACGAWGSVTEVCPHPGQYAHFMSLNWKVPVMEGSNFRIHVWSRGVCIGACALSLKELLEMPTDVEGKTEMFAKILNEKKEIAGKVKLACRYEPYVKETASKKPVPSTPLTVTATPQAVPAAAPMSSTDPESSQHSNNRSLRASETLKSPLKPGLMTDNLSTTANMSEQQGKKPYVPTRVMSSPAPYSKYAADALTLPVKAILKSISVFDLHSVHMLRKNTPQVLFKVDRKESLTPVSSSSGSGSTAKWTELNWAMKISDDSIIYAVVTSGGVNIGRVDLNPSELISIPVNHDKLTELSTQLENNGAITGKIQILMQLQPYDDFEKSDEIESSDYVSGDEQLVSGNKQQQLSTGTGKKNHQLNNNRHSPEKPPIFDANMLTSAQAVKMGISFNMCIHEIDVIDLKNVHPLTKNYPFVAVACGKWNDTTSISSTGQSAFWTELSWKFPIKPSALLRVIVSSKNVVIGSTAINIDQLLQSKTDKEGLKRVITAITNNPNGIEKGTKKTDTDPGNVTGKVKIAFSLAIVHEEPLSSAASVSGFSTNSHSRLIAATNTPAAAPAEDTAVVNGGVVPSAHTSVASARGSNADQKEMLGSASMPNIPTNINLNGLFNNRNMESTPLNTLKSLPLTSSKTSGLGYDNNYGSLVDMYGGEHLRKFSDHTPQKNVSKKNDRSSHHPTTTGTEAHSNSVLNTTSALSMTQRSDRLNHSQHMDATNVPPVGSSVDLHTASLISQHKTDSYAIQQQSHTSMYESQVQRSDVEDNATLGKHSQYYDNLQGQQQQYQSQSQVLSQQQQHQSQSHSQILSQHQQQTQLQQQQQYQQQYQPQSQILSQHQQQTQLQQQQQQYQSQSQILSQQSQLQQQYQPQSQILSQHQQQTQLQQQQQQQQQQYQPQSQILSQLQQQYVSMTSDRSLQSGTDRKLNKFSTPAEYEAENDQRIEDEQESYVAAMVAESPLFNLTVLEISTVELKSVHKFSKNAPYVKLFCENYQQTTKPNTDGTEICFWKGMGWTFPITDNSILRLAVFSNSTEIGSVSVPGENIKFLPRDRKGIREIILTLANSSSSMTSGKIRVKLKASMVQETELFQSQSYKYSNHHSNGTGSGQHPLQQQQRSISQPSSSRAGQQPHQQQHLPGIRSASPNTFATPTHIAAAGELGLFTQSHGKTHVNMNNSASRTPLGANATHNGSGNSLLSGMVSSNFGGGSLILGANQALQSSGHFKMSGGTPGGQTPTVPLLAIPIQQNNTSGGHHFIHKHGDMPPAALNSGGLMSSSVLSGSNYNSLGISAVDNVQGSVKVQIKGIAVIDLPSAHTFSSNSPTVTIACGKFTAQTEEKEKAGQHATWENLDITFIFDKKSQLRVLISSSQVDIGHCNILRSKILSTKKGNKGYLTLFADLEKDSGKNAGKIKIMYNLYLPNY